MFNSLKIVARHDADADGVYIADIKRRRARRSVDWFVIGGWTLILIKCVLASIAIRHWSIPIADFYVWGPSFIFGILCTCFYLRGEEE